METPQSLNETKQTSVIFEPNNVTNWFYVYLFLKVSW